MIELQTAKNDEGQRLDRFLRKYLNRAPLSRIYKMIRKDVKVNGRRVPPETILKEGDRIVLYLSSEEAASYQARPRAMTPLRQFSVIYEDEKMLAVSKPFGLLTHGDATEKKNTLSNQVQGYLAAKGEYVPGRERTFAPSPVNRLDRNTTGLVLFGKDSETLRRLSKMIRERDAVEKYYLTIVCGKLSSPLDLTDALIKDKDRNLVSLVKDPKDAGKLSRCRVTPLRGTGQYTLVEVQLITGRSHQIRVQLAAAGHPIIGDTKYGDPRINAKLKKELGLTTQLLHAYKLVIEGKEMVAEEPLAFRQLTGELIDGTKTGR